MKWKMDEKFNSDLQNGFDRSKRRSRTEIATESAQYIHKSQYGETIAEKNPLEDRQLEAKLKKLERKQKALAEEYFWSQRQFFIAKAFDENNELKFAKLNKSKMKDELKFPPISSSRTSTANTNRSRHHSAKSQRSLTQNIFPVNPNLNLAKISANYKRLRSTEKRHRLSLDKAQTVLNLTDHNQHAVVNGADDLSEDDSAKEYPLLLPTETSTGKTKKNNANDTRNKTSISQENKNKTGHGQEIPNLNLKESELQSSSHYIGSSDKAFDSDDEIVDMALKKIGHINQEANYKKYSMPDADITKRKNGFIHVLKRSSKSLDNISFSGSKSNMGNGKRNPQTQSLMLDNTTSRTLKSDQLLIKLTKSLPMHLLIKTDETINDLSTVLGYVERNKELAAIEKSIASQTCVFDERFQNLVSTLNAHGEIDNGKFKYGGNNIQY